MVAVCGGVCVLCDGVCVCCVMVCVLCDGVWFGLVEGWG